MKKKVSFVLAFGIQMQDYIVRMKMLGCDASETLDSNPELVERTEFANISPESKIEEQKIQDYLLGKKPHRPSLFGHQLIYRRENRKQETQGRGTNFIHIGIKNRDLRILRELLNEQTRNTSPSSYRFHKRINST